MSLNTFVWLAMGVILLFSLLFIWLAPLWLLVLLLILRMKES